MLGLGANDRAAQVFMRSYAQFAAQREAAVELVAEADVDHRQVGQAQAERGQRLGAAGVGRDLVAVLFQRVHGVGADGRVVLDETRSHG